MRKDQIKLGQLRAIPPVTLAPTFDNHMRFGDKSGLTHSGLHLVSEFTKNDGAPLAAVAAGQSYTGRLDGRATTISVTDVDVRAKTFKANVTIYGTAKTSTFFPVGTSLAAAKALIQEAWRDHCTYGTSAYGGGDVDVYQQMRGRFRLNWVGMANVGNQQVWIGSALAGSVVTAFPAVNNKFT